MIGKREGPPDAPVLLFGSHQDPVRNGGMFDGNHGRAFASAGFR